MREAPTKKLSRLLEAEGIAHSYTAGDHGMVKWESGGLTWLAANAWPKNDETSTRLVLHVVYPTPEQAVALSVGCTTEHDNAKLREVLESVLKCAGEIKRDSGCDTCPMYRPDGSFADGSWCRLRPELRSLGFEESGR